MVKPSNFGFNLETAETNHFQNNFEIENPHEKAISEFNQVVDQLTSLGIKVFFEVDSASPIKPDAIFPNNWVSFHPSQKMVIYPMQSPNRRIEKQNELIQKLKKKYQINSVLDLSFFENQNQFLEGTGSIVFDHLNKSAYGCLSPRTHDESFEFLCEKLGYQPHLFSAIDSFQRPIYHTNVMMMIGTSFAVICAESIPNKKERTRVIERLKATGREIIEISFNQMNSFCGNMLELENSEGKILCMSEAAFNAFAKHQIDTLSKFISIETFSIPTVEKIGGGGIRCMMAEIF